MIAARAGTRPVAAPQSYRCRITIQGSSAAGGVSNPGLSCRIAATGSSAARARHSCRIAVTGQSAAGWRPKVLIAAAGFSAASPVTADWNGFTGVRRIDIPADHVRGGADIPDYMLLVDETHARLRSSGNGGIVQSASGWDIRFELGDGTKLDHELAEYDPVAGRALAWVRVPLLSAATGATLYLWYGKSGLSQSEANPAGAWRNYAVVWNARTGADRTGLGRTLTPANVAAGALIGDAGDYNGASSVAQSALGLPWLNGLPSLTVEAWWQADAVGHSRGILAVGGGANPDQAILIRYATSGQGGAANTIVAALNTPAGAVRVEAPAGSQSTDPQYGALRWASGQAGSFFLNAGLVTPINTPVARTGALDIGTDTVLQLGSGLSAGSWWDGRIDEVRIRGGVLSEGVLQTQAHNYRYPSTFYGIGEEDAFTTVSKSVVAMPIVGQVTAGQSVDLDILPRCVNPGPGALSIQGYTSPTRGLVTTVGGKARYTPGGTAAGEGSFTFTVKNNARSDTAMARVLVAAGGSIAGYDPALPFGGVGVGVQCLWGQPGNHRTKNWTVVSVRVERTGRINRISWYNKYDTPTRTGYQLGDGGELSWVVRRVTTAPGVLPIQLSPILASTIKVPAPAEPASWDAAYTAAGGTGSRGRFSEFPTLIFDPIDVVAGEMLAFVHTNTRRSSGEISINCAYSTKRNTNQWSPWEYGKHMRVFDFDSLSSYRQPYWPVLTYGYMDGFVAGNPSMGYSSSELDTTLETITIGRGTSVRQVIPMPAWANGKRIRRVLSMFTRYDDTTSADIVCQIRRAGSSPGGGSDNGTLLAAQTIDASTVRFMQNIKGGSSSEPNDPLANLAWDFSGVADNPAIQGGATYYFEFLTSAAAGTTRYKTDRMQRYLENAPNTPQGLRSPDSFLAGMRGQRKTGSSWASLNTAGTHDVPMFAEFA